MSNRNADAGLTLGKRLWYIQGCFETNGTSNPPTNTIRGSGFTKVPPVRTGAGTFLVTLDDMYQDLNAAGTDLQVPSASANWSQIAAVAGLAAPVGGVANASPQTTPVTIQIITINSAGTPTDVAIDAANHNSRVHFFFCFRDSTVQFNKP